MRRLIFLRDFRGFSGGHLKVWHYFRHALESRTFRPVVHFTEWSRLDSSNPWVAAGAEAVRDLRPRPGDAIFLGGTDWQRLDAAAAHLPGPPTPVINIIQGMRHADPDDPRSAWLARPAIRLCVNPLIARALQGLPVSGPIFAIPMGIDTPSDADGSARQGVVLAAAKQPALGRELARRMSDDGIEVRLLDAMLPRATYLDIIARAAAVVFLPARSEGFYLPALEGMALGTTVICPDCVGNRIYLEDGVNAFMPAYERDDILAALRSALSRSVSELDDMRASARETASVYSLTRERDALLSILDHADEIWTATQ